MVDRQKFSRVFDAQNKAWPHKGPVLVGKSKSIFKTKFNFTYHYFSGNLYGGIHIPRGQMRGRGVHEMTMNDHEGEGEGIRNDHVVKWIDFFPLF